MQVQLSVAAVAGLLALLFAIFLSSRLHKVISQPIMHLADAMNSVGRDKRYSLRAKKYGND